MSKQIVVPFFVFSIVPQKLHGYIEKARSPGPINISRKVGIFNKLSLLNFFHHSFFGGEMIMLAIFFTRARFSCGIYKKVLLIKPYNSCTAQTACNSYVQT